MNSELILEWANDVPANPSCPDLQGKKLTITGVNSVTIGVENNQGEGGCRPETTLQIERIVSLNKDDFSNVLVHSLSGGKGNGEIIPTRGTMELKRDDGTRVGLFTFEDVTFLVPPSQSDYGAKVGQSLNFRIGRISYAPVPNVNAAPLQQAVGAGSLFRPYQFYQVPDCDAVSVVDQAKTCTVEPLSNVLATFGVHLPFDHQTGALPLLKILQASQSGTWMNQIENAEKGPTFVLPQDDANGNNETFTLKRIFIDRYTLALSVGQNTPLTESLFGRSKDRKLERNGFEMYHLHEQTAGA